MRRCRAGSFITLSTALTKASSVSATKPLTPGSMRNFGPPRSSPPRELRWQAPRAPRCRRCRSARGTRRDPYWRTRAPMVRRSARRGSAPGADWLAATPLRCRRPQSEKRNGGAPAASKAFSSVARKRTFFSGLSRPTKPSVNGPSWRLRRVGEKSVRIHSARHQKRRLTGTRRNRIHQFRIGRQRHIGAGEEPQYALQHEPLGTAFCK